MRCSTAAKIKTASGLGALICCGMSPWEDLARETYAFMEIAILRVWLLVSIGTENHGSGQKESRATDTPVLLQEKLKI